MALTLDRFRDGYRTFALREEGRTLVALGGTVLAEPLAAARVDPYQILSGRSAELGLIPAGPHPWRDLPVREVLPSVLFMYPNYATFPVGPAAADPVVLAELVRRLRRWGRSTGCSSLSFLYLTEATAPFLAALAGAGAQVVPLSETCVLDVGWTDFDGYLATLASKRRVVVRRELRGLADRSVVVGEEPLEDAAGELVRLRCSLVAKYGGVPSPAREERLLGLVRLYFRPEETVLVTARRAGALLGFMLFLREGDQWNALLAGADHGDPGSRFTYFATAFYHPAAIAPRCGIRRIHYGLGSWEAKTLRGCRRAAMWAAEIRLGTASEVADRRRAVGTADRRE
jgi:hypothetical protein